MAKTLDKKKDFATVHGGGEAHYFQDDTYFDADGKELGGKAAPATPKKTTKAAPAAPEKTTKAAPAVADVDQSPTKDPVDDVAA